MMEACRSFCGVGLFVWLVVVGVVVGEGVECLGELGVKGARGAWRGRARAAEARGRAFHAPRST